MIRLVHSFYLLTIILCAAAYAEPTTDYFAARTIENSAARCSLNLKATDDLDALARTTLMRGDINGDSISDYLLVVHRENTGLVAAYLSAGKNAGLEDATYAGHIAVDADNMPIVCLSDVTGNGSKDIRIAASRTDNFGATRKCVKFAMYDKELERVHTVFFAVLDNVDRKELYHARSTHVVRIRDTNNDGTNEIEVSSRNVELIGKGAREREIPESVAISTDTYAYINGSYMLVKSVASEPTLEQKLVVAAKLSDHGETDRAALIAHSLLADASVPDRVTVQARELLKNSANRNSATKADPADNSGTSKPA